MSGPETTAVLNSSTERPEVFEINENGAVL